MAAGTQINARLKSTIDARKAHVGDQVTAVATSNVKQDGNVVIPKGSKLVGHITQVSASSKGHAESSVGVLFDEAITKQGRHIPMDAGISGVMSAAGALDGAAEMPPDMPMGGMAGGGARGSAGGGGLLSGAAAPVGGAVGGAVGAVGGLGAGATAGAMGAGGGLLGSAQGQAGGLIQGSNGVPFAITRPQVAGMTAGSASQGSVLSARHGNVRLDSGSQVQLESAGRASAGPAAAQGSGSAHASASSSSSVHY